MTVVADLEKRLQLKPGMAGGACRVPADLRLPLPLLKGLRRRGLDYVLVFVRDAAEIAKHAPAAVKCLREDGLLWFAYPKQTGTIKTDINRDHGWSPVRELGFEGVRQISIDDTWSAIRFREPRFSRKG